ncbi:MAG: class I SAM-dependent RNA methyltransferase [Clostridiales bacterium]|jgi:putative N6-adenine-specific DNA methylase|nr:class I SAM-dependent RNA methyltransferase [Clostridiales bacterium]
MVFSFTATASFGLEAVVKREALALGLKNVSVLDGKVNFTGDFSDMAKANLWLRSADRVHLNLGSFNASTFDELFEQTKAMPWSDWIPENGRFTVIGKSVRSQLHSVPACQSIVKKAIAENLKAKYKIEWLQEDGPEYKIQAALLKDEATFTLDTSGQGLHKRGYREQAMSAPLRETAAAALISLTYWRKGRIFLDPVCGSGTLPIEAALIAKNIAPGLYRSFAAEQWPQVDRKIWTHARHEAYAAIDADFKPEIYGSDIDPEAIELAKANSAKAGVGGVIIFDAKALEDVRLPGSYGVAVCNPPYGERLGTVSEVTKLYAQMKSLFSADDTWSLNVLTADEFFEEAYGRKADAKRKLFSGMIKTDYYQYHGQRPPKKP